jgi:hypothetical protein
MAWLCVDIKGNEYLYEDDFNSINIPKGSIKRLIGDQLLKTHGKDHLTWEDEPVEFVEVTNDCL